VSDGRQQTERELKLAISPAAARRLSKLAAFRPPRASKPRRQRIVTTYFDTPNQDLARRGVSLRIRRSGKKRIQTVKASGYRAVASARGEWEWPTEEERPDLGLAAGTPLADQLPPGVDEKLQPVVTTDIVRTSRTVVLDGNTIETALDSGSISAGEAEQPVNELELELREGAPGALYRLALALHATTPLAIETESKVERGLRLKEGAAPSVEKRAAPKLDPGVSAADGFRAIISDALHHLTANHAAALAGDVEGVHQARIAIRRLRSALRLFRPRLETHAATIFEEELRRVGRAIGEARDWDVLCVEMLPESFEERDQGEWKELIRQAADARRAAADAGCTRELGAISFTSLIIGLAAWAESGREHECLLGDRRLERPLAEAVPSLLNRLARKVEKRGRAVAADATPSALHPLRKSLKKLRYGVEFVSSLYPRKRVKRFLRRLKNLQNSLGVINDAAVATRLAEQLAGDGHVELGAPVGAVALSRERARRAAMRKLGEQWTAYRSQERFWR
jgi:triphosphatase